jgi:fumarate reductase iron-sulfur subunit
MADTITLQVARYLPEEDSAVSFQEYEVLCPKEWVVLDSLNYVKGRLDGTLSCRWSCRMGICGSCGTTVNGERKLTCATFLTDYGPGSVRVEPLENFPVIRDLILEIGDFMRKPSAHAHRALRPLHRCRSFTGLIISAARSMTDCRSSI